MIEQISIPENLTWNCSPHWLRIIRIKSNIASEGNLYEHLSPILNKIQAESYRELCLEMPDLSLLDNLQGPELRSSKIRILVSDDQLGEIHRNRVRLSAVCPTLVLDECKGSLPRAIQFLSSLNLPIEVRVSVFMAQDEQSLLNLTNRLLFSPLVKIPVQPFFDVLRSVMYSETPPLTLWDICKENIDQNYFVTDDGKITLAKRWEKEKRFFCDISDSISDISSSTLYKELNSIRNGFSLNRKCSNCIAAKLCSGFFCAIDSEYDCSPFISLIDFMISHITLIKESFAALPEQKKNDVLRASMNRFSWFSRTEESNKEHLS